MSDVEAEAARLPISWNWEFGGHVYGLEPLFLPTRWLERCSFDKSCAFAREYQRSAFSQLPPPDLDLPDLHPIDSFEIDRIFWFRWITGHQTTFALWQLLSAILEKVPSGGPARRRALKQAGQLMRGYSLMLLYASSAPREIYERVIRQPMARQHPNLSGSWASDYAPVRPLVRGKLELGDDECQESLKNECLLNERVHEAIATRLVPSGISLLLSPNVRQGVRRISRGTLLRLYDGIFLTSRADVSYETVVRQLINRIHAIVLDLSVHELYPKFAVDVEDYPADQLDIEIAQLKESAIAVLLDLARLTGDATFD